MNDFKGLTPKNRLAEILSEIEDKKQYLINCGENYSEYVIAAQQLFPAVYEKMERLDKEDKMNEPFYSKILEFKNAKDIDGEISILKKLIEKTTYYPSIYERIAILYGKKNDFASSLKVCNDWFETDFWKIPNMNSGSLALLNRIEKLKKKLNITDSKN